MKVNIPLAFSVPLKLMFAFLKEVERGSTEEEVLFVVILNIKI